MKYVIDNPLLRQEPVIVGYEGKIRADRRAEIRRDSSGNVKEVIIHLAKGCEFGGGTVSDIRIVEGRVGDPGQAPGASIVAERLGDATGPNAGRAIESYEGSLRGETALRPIGDPYVAFQHLHDLGSTDPYL